MNASISPTIACSICLSLDADDLNQCLGCGEFICNQCPAFACSCIDSDHAAMQTLRSQLRADAIALECLKAQHMMMGDKSLTDEQRARLGLLTDVVPSLRAEINRLDEIRCGEHHPEDVA